MIGNFGDQLVTFRI
jgi:hypothetical protein